MMTRFSRLTMIALLWSVPLGAMAQQPATAPTQPLLKPAELDQLLAPIALHPDPLLSEVLIASTYPLEVVQADRWAKSNKALKGDALTAALAKQSWDDSVKSLVQVPSVLTMMSEQLDWTQKLGDAVLAQQADVMDATFPALRSPRASHSQLALPFAMPSGATATGAAATSTSSPTGPSASRTSIAGSGNTTQITVRV